MGLVGLLPSTFNSNLEPQINSQKAQYLVNFSGSSTGDSGEWTQSQGLVQEVQATESMQFLPVAVASEVTEFSQPNFREPTDPVDGIFLRGFILLALISGSLGWLRRERNHKKQRAKHVSDIPRKVENLEKIGKVTPNVTRSISPLRRERIS
ncbi:MAG: hypothetical protein F6K28_01060 [Microcoleus sp. SIO2G3]|nr:hypothetical protein [Microcoleus sp. SIO2G3]